MIIYSIHLITKDEISKLKQNQIKFEGDIEHWYVAWFK